MSPTRAQSCHDVYTVWATHSPSSLPLQPVDTACFVELTLNTPKERLLVYQFSSLTVTAIIFTIACAYSKSGSLEDKLTLRGKTYAPILSHSGGSILHFCLCLRLTASHSGTFVCIDGLKGPKSPCGRNAVQ